MLKTSLFSGPALCEGGPTFNSRSSHAVFPIARSIGKSLLRYAGIEPPPLSSDDNCIKHSTIHISMSYIRHVQMMRDFLTVATFLIIISQVSSERPGERHPLFPDWSAVCVDITWPEHSSAALPGLHGGAAVPLSGLPPAVTAAVTCSRLFRWLRHNFIHGLPRHCRHWLLFLKRVCRKDKLIFFY